MSNSNPIYRVTDTELTAVASAIRAKTGATASYCWSKNKNVRRRFNARKCYL